MGKNYKTSSKPYMGMRGMSFDNPLAVKDYQAYPKSCKFCQSNTRSRDYICYQCKRDGLDNMSEKAEVLANEKGYTFDSPSGRMIDTDEMLERFHKGWIELGDGSRVEVTQTARELYNSQEMRERKRRQYILRELMNAKYCKRINGCKFKPFTGSECKCFGDEEEA